jgi:hypothetical protein
MLRWPRIVGRGSVSGLTGEPPERLHDVAGVPNQFLKGSGEARHTMFSTNFDRYAHGSAHLHVHFAVWGEGLDVDGDELYAVFMKSNQPLDDRLASCHVEGEDCVFQAVRDGQEIPVLVGVFEPTEHR